MSTYDEQWFDRWFGPGVDPDAATKALELLDDQCKRRFGVPAYRSPGWTGLQIWARRYGEGYRPLPSDLQKLIRDTGTQGRFECCPAVDTLPVLYCLDLRWAYEASGFAVTGGKQWRHEERPRDGWVTCADVGLEAMGFVPGWLGYTPARYRVRFSTPTDWRHVGILPYKVSGWNWPYEAHDCDTWADHTEVRLAIERGWKLEILERLVCVDEVKTTQMPLRGWCTALLKLRDDLCAGIHSCYEGCHRCEESRLYSSAIRAVILQTIGMMAARPRTVERTVGSRADLPDHDLAEETYWEDDQGQVHFSDYDRSGLSRFLHPEIAHAVWGVTRAWLLKKGQRLAGQDRNEYVGALSLPREQVVGFGLDCIYSTHDPQWPDDGREGRWRVKWERQGPLPAPKGRGELEAYGKDS